jgi:hypothetical protein
MSGRKNGSTRSSGVVYLDDPDLADDLELDVVVGCGGHDVDGLGSGRGCVVRDVQCERTLDFSCLLPLGDVGDRNRY